jgi:5-amino-6-(5-phosphoribosylamino)uracil reductase
MTAVGSAWSRSLFDGWFYRCEPDSQQERPAIGLVFVQSADGNTGAEDPESLGGGATDTHLVYEGLSRVDADGVLAGAVTAAGDATVFSVWHPEIVRLRGELGKPRHPAQIVLTDRGELPVGTALLYNEPELRTIVVTGSVGAGVLARTLGGRRWVEVIDAGQPVDLRRALRELHARGIRVISAIGGRRVARALLRERLVDELYLTTSARRGGEPGTPLVEDGLPEHVVLLEKRGKGAERGVQFQHLVFRTQP